MGFFSFFRKKAKPEATPAIEAAPVTEPNPPLDESVEDGEIYGVDIPFDSYEEYKYLTVDLVTGEARDPLPHKIKRPTEGSRVMTGRKIYFDMDNVLADFDKGVVEMCGLTPGNQDNPDPAQDERMWESIRDIEHFYDRLDLVPGADEMFGLLNEQYRGNCEILTGIPKAKRGIVTAGEDKIRWMRRMLSETIPVNIVYKEEKKNYCTGKHCILIDDYSRNIKEWEACGGTGVLFRNARDTIVQLRRMGILFSNAAADSDSDEQP